MKKEERIILENIFEKAYSEYKEYNDYVNKVVSELEKERADFHKYVDKNKKNMEDIFEKLYEVNEKPQLHKSDLLKLQQKLVHYYNALKDVIDIPKDVREEIHLIPLSKLSYKIENGEAVEINKEMNEQIRKYVKENSMGFIKNLIK